jgi:hypothetical protein
MKKRRTRFKKGSGFMPLRYLFLILFLLALYVLIEDGYDFFVRMGWNVGILIFLRKGSCIFSSAMIIGVTYVLVTADESFWHGPFELLDR